MKRLIDDLPIRHATRSKSRISKPNPKYVLAVSLSDIAILRSPKEALLIPEWKSTMIEEFEVLKRNNT